MATLTTLTNFNGTDGSGPEAGLISDAAGNLFGTTFYGGANGDGTVFEIAKTDGGYASTPTTLASFNDTDGSGPEFTLIADATGNLLGTTYSGGANGLGVVFEIALSDGSYASTPTTVLSFSGTRSIAGLTTDSEGNLLGTTESGGNNGNGAVFEIPYTNGAYTGTPVTLASFNPATGDAPFGSLVTDAVGDLFGVTNEGGTYGDGAVFEVAHADGGYAGTPTTLVSFKGSDGLYPTYNLVIDANGDLFGTTEVGGADGDGVVFEVPYADGNYASTPTTLVSFNGADGSRPLSGLIVDAAGDLFGATTEGGAQGDGTVFEVPRTDGSYASTPTILASFNGADGSFPVDGLAADAAGNLVGTTLGGGANGDGTVFELTNTGFIVCFLAGTLIATPKGELPVEELAAGDMAMTLRGEARRVVWIGEGRVVATRGCRNAATPVIVCKGALAENVPHHDLRVTKAHSLYIDDVLIPVEFLVNHRSIIWDDRAQEVKLYHIELETHDVLLANGAPAESYRDDGNRWLFGNANSGWGLPPQAPCAAVLTGGPVVDAVWRRLVDRSGPRPGVPLTDDPGLHLMVDGEGLDATDRVGGAWVFHLSAVPSELRIMSRAAAPAELGLARDPRVLGVALQRLVVRQGMRFRVVEADDDRLIDGFHAFEADNGFRWTDGDATVPSGLFAGFRGPVQLVLHIGGSAQYVADGPVQRAA